MLGPGCYDGQMEVVDKAASAGQVGQPRADKVSPGRAFWRKRWARRVLAILVCLLILYGLRGPLLHLLGSGLVAEDRIPERYSVWILGGDYCFKHAAEHHFSGRCDKLLMVERVQGRLQQLGVRETFTQTAQRRLKSHGIDWSLVTVINEPAVDEWDQARSLRAWLEVNPTSTVLILCPRFDSRRMRRILDEVLDASAAKRVCVQALPDRRFNEADWWKSKPGTMEVFNGYLSLAFAVWHGEDPKDSAIWDPDQYEKSLQ